MPAALITGARPESAEPPPNYCTPVAIGSQSEVAEVVAFLASPAAGYVTGQDVVVAGGYGLGA